MEDSPGFKGVSELSYVWSPCDELAPALPLRTAVSLLERGLVGRPAAVFVVEPEADETNAVLHICQPVSCDVDATGQSTWMEQI